MALRHVATAIVLGLVMCAGGVASAQLHISATVLRLKPMEEREPRCMKIESQEELERALSDAGLDPSSESPPRVGEHFAILLTQANSSVGYEIVFHELLVENDSLVLQYMERRPRPRSPRRGGNTTIQSITAWWPSALLVVYPRSVEYERIACHRMAGSL